MEFYHDEIEARLQAAEAIIIGAAACAIPHPAERAVLQEAVNMAIAAKRKAKRKAKGESS